MNLNNENVDLKFLYKNDRKKMKFLQKRHQRLQFQSSIQSFLKSSSSIKSQASQDLFALFASDFKRGGYFVEFGATDGMSLNNTWLLENKFQWSGILAEPARLWQANLVQNRSCHIEFDCVWSRSGETVDFLETSEATLSTIEEFHDHDGRLRLKRGDHKTYQVKTISLIDLLRKYQAPQFIDFMSVDTEGSEYEILKAFDWSAYRFGSICIEHNYTNQRSNILALLQSNGYKRVFEGLSGADDWYVAEISSK